MSLNINIIARIENNFTGKFGIPRQSGLADSIESKIIFEKPYRDDNALRGIDGYSHLWLLWYFSENKEIGWSPTVRPPRLGGNTRMGVFATRSPNRPSPIGLSSVKLARVEKTKEFGSILYVTGADLMNGTPILDIKPYLAFTDCHPDAVDGFAREVKDNNLKVVFPQNKLLILPEIHRDTVLKILQENPIPSYKSDENRIYGMSYGGYEIKFTVKESTLTVADVYKS